MYPAQQNKPMLPLDSIQPSLLSYNNRPNPVEPQSLARSVSQPSSVFTTQSNEEISRVLHKNAIQIAPPGKLSDGTFAKRRELEDGKTLNLPKPPVRMSQERRQRLPPTLSGLHQPPPNAGLLPSISVERPDYQKHSIGDGAGQDPSQSVSTRSASSTSQWRGTRATHGRNKWTDLETKQLLQGVSRFGIGSWTKILHCSDYDFGKRTAADLKDRFRVCYPEQYGSFPGRARASDKKLRSDRRSTTANLADLGVHGPFERKSVRRQRNKFTEEDDQHLLTGFEKHGKLWSKIQLDPTLKLDQRTSTELRDRMRARFSDRLNAVSAASPDISSTAEPTRLLEIEPHDQTLNKVVSPTKTQQFHAPLDVLATSWLDTDPYMSITFDDDDDLDAQAITLDRGILDWPFPGSAAMARSDSQALKPPGIGRPPGNVSSLPSLATITAPGNQHEDKTIHELPALAHFFGPHLDMDDRSNAHAFLSLDELIG